MKILIVIDMQNDFVTGALGSEAAQAVVPLIERKIDAHDYDTLRFTFDTHYSYYSETLEGKKLPVPHCIEGTEGWETALGKGIVQPLCIVKKETFGYMSWLSELGNLNESDSIELVGVCTDICVVSNALILRAQYPDTPITVDASCCAGTTGEAHKAALEVMKSCQIDVIND